jgi:twitching motility protein PilI
MAREPGKQLGRLREFSTQLAERLKAAPSRAGEPLRLAVRIGTDSYLLPMEAAGEIVAIPDITPVPWTKPWYRGLANVRGRLTGVIDLMQYAGRGAMAPEQAQQLLVLSDSAGVNAALLVTRAFGLRNLNELESLGRAENAAAPWETTRYRDLDGGLLTEIDVRGLVASEGFGAIGA